MHVGQAGFIQISSFRTWKVSQLGNGLMSVYPVGIWNKFAI